MWTIGTHTSKSGTLVNTGVCLTYSSTAMGGVVTANCDSSDPDQIWHDGGATS